MDNLSQAKSCIQTAELLAKIEELETQKKKFVNALQSNLTYSDHSCLSDECCETYVSTETNSDNSDEGKNVEICCHHTHEYRQILIIPTREDEDVVLFEVEKFLIKLYNNCLVDKVQNHRYLIISSFEKYVIIFKFR